MKANNEPTKYLTVTERGQTRYVPDHAPELPVRRVTGEVLPPVQPDLYLPQPARPLSTVQLHTTYVDRSKGYLVAMLPLAGVASVLGVTVAVTLFSVPLLSGPTLLVFWAIFAGVYLISYLAHMLISADGAAFLSVFGVFLMASREQRHRHEVFWQRYDDDKDGAQ